jgi:hypothetical protein
MAPHDQHDIHKVLRSQWLSTVEFPCSVEIGDSDGWLGSGHPPYDSGRTLSPLYPRVFPSSNGLIQDEESLRRAKGLHANHPDLDSF